MQSGAPGTWEPEGTFPGRAQDYIPGTYQPGLFIYLHRSRETGINTLRESDFQSELKNQSFQDHRPGVGKLYSEFRPTPSACLSHNMKHSPGNAETLTSWEMPVQLRPGCLRRS